MLVKPTGRVVAGIGSGTGAGETTHGHAEAAVSCPSPEPPPIPKRKPKPTFVATSEVLRDGDAVLTGHPNPIPMYEYATAARGGEGPTSSASREEETFSDGGSM